MTTRVFVFAMDGLVGYTAGGLATQMRHIVQGMRADTALAEQYEWTFFVNPVRGQTAEELRACGIDFVRVVEVTWNRYQLAGGLINTAFHQSDMVAAAQHVVTAIDKGQPPDLILAFDAYVAVAVHLLARLWHRPYIFGLALSMYGYMTDLVKAGVEVPRGRHKLRRIEFMAMEDARAIYVCSEYMKEVAQKILTLGKTQRNPPIHVIYNGFDNNRPPPAPCPFRVDAPWFRILFVGRLSAMKGVLQLLEAKLPPQCHLVLMYPKNATEEPPCVEALHEARKCRDNVWVMDAPISGPARYRYFDQADVIIMPSIHEPFGIVALEALQSAQPDMLRAAFVCSRRGGLAEIVPENACYACEPTGDGITAALAEWYEDRLYRHDKLRERLQAAKDHAHATVGNFSWPRACTVLHEVMQMCLADPLPLPYKPLVMEPLSSSASTDNNNQATLHEKDQECVRMLCHTAVVVPPNPVDEWPIVH